MTTDEKQKQAAEAIDFMFVLTIKRKHTHNKQLANSPIVVRFLQIQVRFVQFVPQNMKRFKSSCYFDDTGLLLNIK